jgi:hypothetical protein
VRDSEVVQHLGFWPIHSGRHKPGCHIDAFGSGSANLYIGLLSVSWFSHRQLRFPILGLRMNGW